MSPVSAISSIFSYINALPIPSAITRIFNRTIQPHPFQVGNPTCVPDRFSLLPRDQQGYIRLSFLDYLKETSGDYPSETIQMSDGKNWEIARTWLTDIERIGRPDEFFLNGKKIEKAPETLEEKLAILQLLIEVAEGDKHFVRAMTEIWSYRPKMRLMDEITEEFHHSVGLRPIVKREDYQIVRISLHTEDRLLTCHIRGDIHWMSDANLDLFPTDHHFEANLIYCAIDNDVQIYTKFFKTSVNQTQ